MHEYKLPKIKKVIIDPKIIERLKVENDFTKLSLDIMIEVGSYICVVANIFPAKTKAWDLNWAIVGGHLVRLYKLISAMLDQTCQRKREISFIFSRLAFECIINLRYLIKHESDELFKSYRKYSLQHEYKLYKKISENIKKRSGKELDIERRILDSIIKSFQVSGISIDEIKSSKLKNWGGKNIFEKASDLELEDAYLAAFGGGSHNIHGNWQDLLEYHLEETENGYFTPVFDWHQPKPEMLNVIALYSTETVIECLNWINEESIKDMEDELIDLKKRILLLDNLHERFLS